MKQHRRFIIREAQTDDLEKLAELFDDYRTFYRKSPDKNAAKEFIAARLICGDSKIYVCIEPYGTIAGFVQLYPLFSSTRMQRLWLLNDLYVASIYRGGGYSTALINRAKKLCRESGAAGLTLETEKDNEVANSLYRSTDFNINLRHNFYSWDCSLANIEKHT
jgi:ribosomal protein S18 acetylase RimI-like enzyme